MRMPPVVLPAGHGPFVVEELTQPTLGAEATMDPRVLSPSKRARVSLSILPSEIKRLIVDKIAEGGPLRVAEGRARPAGGSFTQVEVGAGGGGGGGGGEGGTSGNSTAPDSAAGQRPLRRSPLRAMALVNREFAALAEPHLWANIELSRYFTRSFVFVIGHVLPRHGRHITSLSIPDFVCDDPVATLLSRAIVFMTKLSRVRCHLSLIFDSSSEPTCQRGRGCVQATCTPVACALGAHGPSLQRLCLFGEGVPLIGGDFDSLYLSPSSYELSDQLFPKHTFIPGGPALPLPNLRLVDISTTQTGEFLSSFSTCPLQDLKIEYSPNIRWKAWNAFVRSHAMTLRCVTIGADALAFKPWLDVVRLQRFCESKGIEFVLEDDEEDGGEVGSGNEWENVEEEDVGKRGE